MMSFVSASLFILSFLLIFPSRGRFVGGRHGLTTPIVMAKGG